MITDPMKMPRIVEYMGHVQDMDSIDFLSVDFKKLPQGRLHPKRIMRRGIAYRFEHYMSQDVAAGTWSDLAVCVDLRYSFDSNGSHLMRTEKVTLYDMNGDVHSEGPYRVKNYARGADGQVQIAADKRRQATVVDGLEYFIPRLMVTSGVADARGAKLEGLMFLRSYKDQIINFRDVGGRTSKAADGSPHRTPYADIPAYERDLQDMVEHDTQYKWLNATCNPDYLAAIGRSHLPAGITIRGFIVDDLKEPWDAPADSPWLLNGG